jgi:hypothetical protein
MFQGFTSWPVGRAIAHHPAINARRIGAKKRSAVIPGFRAAVQPRSQPCAANLDLATTPEAKRLASNN